MTSLAIRRATDRRCVRKLQRFERPTPCSDIICPLFPCRGRDARIRLFSEWPPRPRGVAPRRPLSLAAPSNPEVGAIPEALALPYATTARLHANVGRNCPSLSLRSSPAVDGLHAGSGAGPHI